MKQTEGTETANVSFDLGAATMKYGNNAPYFQWGRKDPMIPSTGVEWKNKPTYTNEYSTTVSIIANNIHSTIVNPHGFNEASSSNSIKLWNVSNSTDIIIKSIYDPCPKGFHIPPQNAFEGFNSSGRWFWDNLKCGIWIYQLGIKSGTLVFFPAMAIKTNQNNFDDIGYGEYFTALPSSSIYFSSGSFVCGYDYGRVVSLLVRPVAE